MFKKKKQVKMTSMAYFIYPNISKIFHFNMLSILSSIFYETLISSLQLASDTWFIDHMGHDSIQSSGISGAQ